MTNSLRDLPVGFRVAIFVWAMANVIVLGLFIIGPNGYRIWFFDWGFFLELGALFALVGICDNIWRNR
jgi:hypothetical protein